VTLVFPDNQSFYSQNDALVVQLNQQQKTDNWVFEIDQIDVTALVEATSREGKQQLKIQLPQPLSLGVHELQITHFKDNGDIDNIGFWEVNVQQNALYTEAQWQAQLDFAGNYRVAEKNVEEDAQFSAQGSAVLMTQIQSQDISLSGQMDLFYVNQEEFSARGRSLDMGEFLLVAEHGRFKTQLGHHQLDHASLLMDSFERRGLSSQVTIDEIQSRVSGFVLRTEPIIGFHKGLGVSNHDNRVSGLTWDYAAFDDDPNKMVFTTAWLKGKGTNDGFGVEASGNQETG